MTSKEIDKILKSPITQSAKGSFISIEQLEQIKNKLEESEKQSNLTFDECIKKWEEREYEVNISMDRNLVIESEKYDLCISICKANLIYEISDYYECNTAFMTLELHELLTQTLKAMEKMKNDKN